MLLLLLLIFPLLSLMLFAGDWLQEEQVVEHLVPEAPIDDVPALQEVKKTRQNQGQQRWVVGTYFTPSMSKRYIPTTACFQAADVEVQDGFLALAAFHCYCW